MWKIKLQKIKRNLLDKLWKLYMNGTVITKFLTFLKIWKILGNFYFSKQIFYRQLLLGAPGLLFDIFNLKGGVYLKGVLIIWK